MGHDEWAQHHPQEYRALMEEGEYLEEDEDGLADNLPNAFTLRAADPSFEEVAWLEPLLSSWYGLHALQVMSLSCGPAFPVLDPLAIASVLMPPQAEHKA